MFLNLNHAAKGALIRAAAIDCRMVRSTHFPGIPDIQDYEMTVFTIRNERRRIAWSETKGSVRYPPTLLTRDFINALKKTQK